MWIFSLLTSSLGRMAVVALVCFLAGAVICWRWTHREAKTFSYTLPVVSIENGATISVEHGLLGKKRTVMISGISAPGLNDQLGPESQMNLKGLAGGSIRVESKDRPIGLLRAGAGTIVGEVFGDTGSDLGVAQLRAGLATCETGATKEQLAGQREAQKAKRGLWAKTDIGSHWWHFSSANQEKFPEAIDQPKERAMFFDLPTIGGWLLIAAAAFMLFCLVWHFVGAAVTAKAPAAGNAVTTAVDTSEQLMAYGALTVVRHSPAVEADPQAVQYCDYLRTVCTSWPPAKK